MLTNKPTSTSKSVDHTCPSVLWTATSTQSPRPALPGEWTAPPPAGPRLRSISYPPCTTSRTLIAAACKAADACPISQLLLTHPASHGDDGDDKGVMEYRRPRRPRCVGDVLVRPTPLPHPDDYNNDNDDNNVLNDRRPSITVHVNRPSALRRLKSDPELSFKTGLGTGSAVVKPTLATILNISLPTVDSGFYMLLDNVPAIPPLPLAPPGTHPGKKKASTGLIQRVCRAWTHGAKSKPTL